MSLCKSVHGTDPKMKSSQIIVWAIAAALTAALWIYSAEESVLLKLLQTVVLLVVANAVAALGTIRRTPR